MGLPKNHEYLIMPILFDDPNLIQDKHENKHVWEKFLTKGFAMGKVSVLLCEVEKTN